MKKAENTHIAMVLDRSGSMQNIRHDMEGAIASFVEDQKKLKGNCTFTLAQFDGEYDVIYDGIDLQEVDSIELVPRGSTALLDAMGKTLSGARTFVAELPKKERPKYKVACIITDGGENASREWTKDRVVNLVKELESDGWLVTYLGANQDAIAVGGGYGFSSDTSLTFAANSAGVAGGMGAYSSNVSMLRSTGVATPYTDDQRKQSAT